MQKSLYLLLSAAALAGLSSCASEEPIVPQNGDVESFTISLPAEVTSRDFTDGTSVRNIYVAVYPSDSDKAKPYISSFTSSAVNKSLVTGDATVSNLTANIGIQLVKGKDYNVFFWAESYDDGTGPYKFNPSERTIDIDYAKMTCNSDTPDAFYYYGKISANGNTHEIQMRRPLAQINIGTDDYQQASMSGLEVTSTAVTFSSLANKFNFTDGSATGNSTDVTLNGSAIPDSESFPTGNAGQYRYLSMAYVLVNSPAEGNAVIDNISLSINGNAYEPYINIPVKRNYRTNIYGSLLTKQIDFEVSMTGYGDDINQEQIEFVSVSSATDFKKAVTDGKNIILSKDISFLGQTNISINYPIIIDLNGFNLSESVSSNTATFIIAPNNQLTIQGKGEITSNSTLIKNSGTLLIKGADVTFEAVTRILQNEAGASCTIEGGIYKTADSSKPSAVPIYNSGELVIDNGTFISHKDSYVLLTEVNSNSTINDGKFVGKRSMIINGGTVNINDGFFSSQSGSATIYLSPTATNGVANIKGGYFTNLWKKGSDTEWDLPSGYEKKALESSITEIVEGKTCTYYWQVVPKTGE